MERLTLLETFYWHNNIRKDWENSILSNEMECLKKMQVAAGQYVKGLLTLGDDWESVFKNELIELNKFGNAEGKKIQQRINQFREQVISSLRLQQLNNNTERRLRNIDNALGIILKQNNENGHIGSANVLEASPTNYKEEEKQGRGRKPKIFKDYINQNINIECFLKVLHSRITKKTSGSNANMIIRACYPKYITTEEPNAEAIHKEFNISAETVRKDRREHRGVYNKSLKRIEKKYDAEELELLRKEIDTEYQQQ